jgi:hypothetical protein
MVDGRVATRRGVVSKELGPLPVGHLCVPAEHRSALCGRELVEKLLGRFSKKSAGIAAVDAPTRLLPRVEARSSGGYLLHNGGGNPGVHQFPVVREADGKSGVSASVGDAPRTQTVGETVRAVGGPAVQEASRVTAASTPS